MRTTATYDPQTQQFVLHSDDFEAAKCWVGNLGNLKERDIYYTTVKRLTNNIFQV